MCRATISSSTSNARASTAPVTGSEVITSVTTTPGSTPAASTRVRRSRSVTMPASRSPSMTSRDDTRCSDMTLRGLAHRGGGGHRHRLAADEVADPGLEDGAARRRQLQRGDRPAHPAGPLGVEEGVDLGVVGAQPVEVLGGQEQGQAVLDGGDVAGSRGCPGSGWSSRSTSPRPRGRAGCPGRRAPPPRPSAARRGGGCRGRARCSVVPRRKYSTLIRAGRASSTASGRTSNGSWCARKSRVSDSSTSRAMPPSWQRAAAMPAEPRSSAAGAPERSGIPRRTGHLPQVAKPRAVRCGCWNEAPRRRRWRPRGRWGAMSDSTIEPLPDGDGKLGNAEGPADSGAGDSGQPGEHDGGADGGAGGGTEGPADSGAGQPAVPGEHDGGADGGAEGPADSGAGDAGPARRARRWGRRRGRRLAVTTPPPSRPVAPALPGRGATGWRRLRSRSTARRFARAALGPRPLLTRAAERPHDPAPVRAGCRRRAARAPRPAHAVPADGPGRRTLDRLGVHPRRRRRRDDRRPGQRGPGAAPVRRRRDDRPAGAAPHLGPASPTPPRTSPPTSATPCRSTPTSRRRRTGASTTTTTSTTCFVVQVAGEKHWQVRPPVLESPLRDQPWTDRRDAVAAGRRRAPPTIDAVLRPGDCLYVPRGWLHSATALGGTSIHLTMGVHVWTRAPARRRPAAGGRRERSTPTRRCGAALDLGVDAARPGRSPRASSPASARPSPPPSSRSPTTSWPTPWPAGCGRRSGPSRSGRCASTRHPIDPETSGGARRHLAARWEPGPGDGVATLVTRVARVDVPSTPTGPRSAACWQVVPRMPSASTPRAPIALSRRAVGSAPRTNDRRRQAEARTTSRVGSTVCGRHRLARRSGRAAGRPSPRPSPRPAGSPTSARGRCAGRPASRRSPTSATSPGTRSPASRSTRRAPTAIRSEAANTASGTSPVGEHLAHRALPAGLAVVAEGHDEALPVQPRRGEGVARAGEPVTARGHVLRPGRARRADAGRWTSRWPTASRPARAVVGVDDDRRVGPDADAAAHGRHAARRRGR